MLSSEEKIYFSSHSICLLSFFNMIKVLGLPNNSLKLKVGTRVMLFKNIDISGGFSNGIGLQITQLVNHIFEATITTRNRVGHKVFIPRMVITPSANRLPFKIRRMYFPLTVAFVMTSKKIQGRTHSRMGVVSI